MGMGGREGKAALVTGATSGIGVGICRALLAQGVRVAFCGRREEEGRKIQAEIGPQSRFFRADVTLEADVRQLVASSVAWAGRLDILVNNAGILPPPQPIAEESEADYYQITDVNIKGVVLVTKYALPHMVAQRSGAICNISSTRAIRGREGDTPLYCATKGAVSALTRALAVRHGPDGIRVNAVLPAFVPTDTSAAVIKWRDWTEAEWKQAAQLFPLRRVGTPDDIGAAVAFLCSDAAGWITGIELVVDGGFTAR
jgi:NAD(P)-dependent dehydrogenase (short-subunit alcohol dehydrogenase family)